MNDDALFDQIRAAVDATGVLASADYAIARTGRRKRVGLVVLPGGSVEIGVPAKGPEADPAPAAIADMVTRASGQLWRSINRRTAFTPAHPVKELTGGEGFGWRGRSHRLRLARPDGPHPVALSSGNPSAWLLIDPAVAADQDAARAALTGFYIREGQALLDRLDWRADYAARLGVEVPVAVRAMGHTRWGAYEPLGHRVSLNWQLFQLPITMIIHVLVHELAHAAHPHGGHGPAWRTAMDGALPGWQETKRLQDQAGLTMWRGDLAVRAG